MYIFWAVDISRKTIYHQMEQMILHTLSEKHHIGKNVFPEHNIQNNVR